MMAPLAAADAREELRYRDLRERIADGVTVRQFAEFYSDPMVKHNPPTALHRLSRRRQNNQ
jgi:hypothetical protein